MSTSEGKQRRQLRSFTSELKAGAMKLVLVGTKTLPRVAPDLAPTQSALRTWVEEARADRCQSSESGATSLIPVRSLPPLIFVGSGAAGAQLPSSSAC